MAPTLRQSKGQILVIGAGATITLDAAPQVGNLLVAMCAGRDIGTFTLPAGWTRVDPELNTTGGYGARSADLIYRRVQAGDTGLTLPGGGGHGFPTILAEFAGVTDTLLAHAGLQGAHAVNDVHGGGNVSPASIHSILVVGGCALAHTNDTITMTDGGGTGGTTVVLLMDNGSPNHNPGCWLAYKVVNGSGTYSVDGIATASAGGNDAAGQTGAFEGLDLNRFNGEPGGSVW